GDHWRLNGWRQALAPCRIPAPHRAMASANWASYLAAMDHGIDPQLAAWLDPKFEEFAQMVAQAVQRMEDRLNARFDRLEERVTRLEEAVTRLEERVTALEERVTALEERMTALEERMTALEERVGVLEGRMGRLESE